MTTRPRTTSSSSSSPAGGTMDLLSVDQADTSGDHLTVNAPPPNYSIATSSNFDSLMRGNGTSPRLAADMAEVGRRMGRGKHSKRRLVMKSGECNITRKKVMKRHSSYLKDIFTTLVDMKWRFHIILFTSGFVISWCSFALVWFIIAYLHGDTVDGHSFNNTVCIEGVYSFHTALLFSIETQHTIGYGTRAITDVCWYTTIVLMLQSCLGTFVQALITGIIFAKISRPKGRAQTILFSEKAVICRRDSEYFLLFRVGDMRRSHIIGTSIRAMLVKNRLTEEGESIPLCQYHLNLESETSRSDCFAFLVWPVTVVHKIDSSSPLWDLSASELYQEYFEIIVILEGTIESTGSLTQVRTSYIPAEIRWGERLTPLVTFQRHNGKYEIDYDQFHNTIPMTNMQTYSARENYEATVGAGGVGVDETTDDKDFPVSFTSPAVRGGSASSLRKQALQGLFSKKSRHSQPQEQQQQESSEYITVGGITLRNPNHETIQRPSGYDNSAGDTINSSATISNSMITSRRPGSKRPLWFDKQSLNQLTAGRRDATVNPNSSRRLYSSGRSKVGYSSGELANGSEEHATSSREDVGLMDNSVVGEDTSERVASSSVASSTVKIYDSNPAIDLSDHKADIKPAGIIITVSSPGVDLHTIEETVKDQHGNNNNIASDPKSSNIDNGHRESSNSINSVELNNSKNHQSSLGDSVNKPEPVSNSLPNGYRDSNISEAKPDLTTRRNSRFIVSSSPKIRAASKMPQPEAISDTDEGENFSASHLDPLSAEPYKLPILVNLADCTSDA